MIRKTILAASVALVAMAAPAFGQQYPPAGPSCSASDTTVEVGQEMSVTCSGFDPGTTATFELTSSPIHLGTAQVNGEGHVSLAFHVPHVKPGHHAIHVSGLSNGHDAAASISIKVLGDRHGADDRHKPHHDGMAHGGERPGTPQGGQQVLARTGSDTETMLARVGAGLLATGGAFLLVARKRRIRLSGTQAS